jgi:heme/copper-type cytochrome/quinol oxidase subunit 2
MFVLATPIVDWNAMWKIFLVVLIAGTGTVVAFGFVLLGLKVAHRQRPDGTVSESSRLGGFFLSFVCGVLVLGVVVVGVYAMTKKPKSKPAAKPTKSALIVPDRSRARLSAPSS